MTERNNHVSPLLLAPPQVEALRQLAGLASSDAARSLGRLLGTSVDAEVPRAQVAVGTPPRPRRWSALSTNR